MSLQSLPALLTKYYQLSMEDISTAIRLWQHATSASLATIEDDGSPHVSLVTMAVTGGSALFLLSDLARHTINLNRDDRCSILLADGQTGANDILTGERISVHGKIALLPDDKVSREIYLAIHPQAATYIKFSDFSLYRFSPGHVFLVAGFGRIKTLDGKIFSS